jgi:hypothetical protein
MTWTMHEQLWGYRIVEKLHLKVSEQKIWVYDVYYHLNEFIHGLLCLLGREISQEQCVTTFPVLDNIQGRPTEA